MVYYYLINRKCYWTNNQLTSTIQEDPKLFKVWRKRLRRLQVEAKDLIDLELELFKHSKSGYWLSPIDFTAWMLQNPNPVI